MRNLIAAIGLLPIVSVLCAIGGHVSAEPTDSTSGKRIALSFDDAPKGPGPAFSGDARTVRLTGALEAADTGPVVFFVTTSRFKKAGGRERVASYAEAGHLIANHSHSHTWLKRTDTDLYIADIDEAESLLTDFENRRSWFRFLFLDEGAPLEKRDAVRVALRERGLLNGYVTIDNYDWYLDMKWKQAVDAGHSVDIDALRNIYVEMLLDAAAFYDSLATEYIGTSPVHMLLLHENDVAALAIEVGLDPRRLSHLAIEESQIDALLVERGVFDDSDEGSPGASDQ